MLSICLTVMTIQNLPYPTTPPTTPPSAPPNSPPNTPPSSPSPPSPAPSPATCGQSATQADWTAVFAVCPRWGEWAQAHCPTGPPCPEDPTELELCDLCTEWATDLCGETALAKECQWTGCSDFMRDSCESPPPSSPPPSASPYPPPPASPYPPPPASPSPPSSPPYKYNDPWTVYFFIAIGSFLLLLLLLYVAYKLYLYFMVIYMIAPPVSAPISPNTLTIEPPSVVPDDTIEVV